MKRGQSGWRLIPRSSAYIWGVGFQRIYLWDDQTGWQLTFGLGRIQYRLQRFKKAK